MTALAARLSRGGLDAARGVALFVLLLVVLGATGAAVPGYLDPLNLLDVSRTFVEPGLLALGMTFVIVSGGIDLSVASLLALSSVVLGLLWKAGVPAPLAALAAVLTGVAGGLLNGAATAWLRLHPFVVTLATLSLFRGLAYAISNAESVTGFPASFTALGQGFVLGGLAPAQLPVLFVAALLAWVLLERTAFGRRVVAVGANETVARFSAIRVERVKLAVYAISGGMAGLAAVIQTARVSTARANAAQGLELTVIAMTVLGGVRITGGSGSVGGVALGVLTLAFLQDGLISAGVRSDWGLVVTGGFLILGVIANGLLARRAA